MEAQDALTFNGYNEEFRGVEAEKLVARWVVRLLKPGFIRSYYGILKFQPSIYIISSSRKIAEMLKKLDFLFIDKLVPLARCDRWHATMFVVRLTTVKYDS